MTARNLFAYVSLSLVPLGLLIALGAHPATAGPIAIFTDLLFWPLDGLQTLGDPQARFYCAISGGVCAGLGALLWGIARDSALDSGRIVRLALPPLLTWFVIDTTGSIAAGAPLNALGNAAYLVLSLAPLLAMARKPGKS